MEYAVAVVVIIFVLFAPPPASCARPTETILNNAESNETCGGGGGEAWFGADCALCRCVEGLVQCDASADANANASQQLCAATPPDCPRVAVPPGQCCPVCLDQSTVAPLPEAGGGGGEGCVGALGERVSVGGAWRLDDCTSCVCEAGGRRRCQAYMCEACPEPRYEPGECCPRCDGGGGAVVTLPSHCPSLLNCSLRCVHGFVRDHNGCFTCHCQQDECLLECPLGFQRDGGGNKLCRCCPPLADCRKRCAHGLHTDRTSGCPVCRCHACPRPRHPCTKRCAHSLLTDHRGCVLCKCAPFHHGLAIGTGTSNETIGTPCVSEGGKVWRDDGETWFDGCRHCYCLAGREMCSLLSCPPAPCPHPIYNSSKHCCPHCPVAVAASESVEVGGSGAAVCQAGADGAVQLEGQTWLVGGGCVRCVCRGGRALCRAASCPPAPCAQPLPPPPGQCCPICPPHNRTLGVGCVEAAWREGDCVSCECGEDGRPTCFTEQCPASQTACASPLRVKHRCCPVCLDKVAGSEVGVGVSNAEAGAESEAEGPPCTKLVCCHLCSSEGGGGVMVMVVVMVVASAAALCAGLWCASRRCRGINSHQLKLHGCSPPAPPQYTHYRYMPTYDSAQQPLGSSEKTALTPL